MFDIKLKKEANIGVVVGYAASGMLKVQSGKSIFFVKGRDDIKIGQQIVFTQIGSEYILIGKSEQIESRTDVVVVEDI